jgi:hypothetical protein
VKKKLIGGGGGAKLSVIVVFMMPICNSLSHGNEAVLDWYVCVCMWHNNGADV